MTNTPAARLATRHKEGRDPDENDDRAIGGTGSRFALADGASTTARAEEWAELLVAAYAIDGVDILELAVLDALRSHWRERVDTAGLPWYAQEKLRRGGAATFVGVDIDVARQRYRAIGIGDACLLHLRDGELITAGPLDHPRQFGRTPALITTHSGDVSHRAALWEHGDDYAGGDHLVLASDGLAKYLLEQKRGGALIDVSMIPGDDDEFRTWVEHARRAGMDNDDTTICAVRL
ncbi:protein phosphatase 2C domain-containing protein [Nocardia sp. NPDC060249]|uniref:protein phosphatase 2C domain-containing protein n=1 Tax=Nocardia sp. NPDC060249 TaxID=3347082 RepID=UPI00365EB61F